jgi:uncharacterized membrane protein YeaQ/YmgE (transglycosylase-associated protein family)
VFVVQLIVWIIVGAIGGWLANYIVSRNTALDLQDVILGMIGAVAGGWIVFILTGRSVSQGTIAGALASIGVAFVGALLSAALYKKVMGRPLE